MTLLFIFALAAGSLAPSVGASFSPRSYPAGRESPRAGQTASAQITDMELTPEQVELLQNGEFRHAVAIAARVGLMRKAAARGDVLSWGKAAMPEKFTLPFCQELHQYLVDIRREKLTAVKAPRGFAKTVMSANLIPMYQALEEPRTYRFYLPVQSNDEKAIAVNRAIKAEIDENEALRAAYGPQVSQRWTDGEFQLRNGVVFKSVGAGVSMRGIQYRNMRPDYIILDDLYDENDIHSIDSTERKNEWVKGTLYKMLARNRPSCMHARGTAINKSDILTEMAGWPGCVSRTFSAIKADGSSMWPELYTQQELADDRVRMGSVIFNRELMNVCQDDSEAIVKSDWLRNWEFDPAARFSRLDREFSIETVVMGCDPSTGEKETGDPSGFATVVKTRGPGTRFDYWIFDLENKVLSWDERLAQLERMQATQNARGNEHRVRRAFVEGIGGFKDFANQAKLRTSLPVEVVSWVKGKKANLSSKSGHFEFGRVHVSRDIPKPLREELLSQLTQNDPRHDDLRDAVLLCMESATLAMRDWV